MWSTEVGPSSSLPSKLTSRTAQLVANGYTEETFLDEYPDRAPPAVVLYAETLTYWVSNRVLAVPIEFVL